MSYTPLKVSFLSKNLLLIRSSANAIEAATLRGVHPIQRKLLVQGLSLCTSIYFPPSPSIPPIGFRGELLFEIMRNFMRKLS